LLVGGLLLASLLPATSSGADFGRLTGTVADNQGNPLMGATVILMGPVLVPGDKGEATTRVITDAQGRFALEHLLPGWYSLQVVSVTRLPALRNGIHIEPGQTSTERFVLADIFASSRFRVPNHGVTSWGDDWKWVLRTSSSTRPILRYQDQLAQASNPPPKAPLPSSQKLIGMMPGSGRRQALAGDSGLGSVLAYLRPLSADSDLLVAGSMAPSGLEATSLATAFRRNIEKSDPLELTLVVHQLSLADGLPLPSGDIRDSLAHAQGMVASYSQTRWISKAVAVTTAMEVDYLSAAQNVVVMRPRVKVAYRVNPDTVLAFHYGLARPEAGDSLLERVGTLSAFPRITLRGYQPRLEELNHAEVALDHQMTTGTRLEVAAFRDGMQNTAIRGSGHPEQVAWLAGNYLVNTAVDGVILNAGDYRSSGLRAAVSQKLGRNVEALVAYSMGDALMPRGLPDSVGPARLERMLRPARSDSITGKVTARIPASHTRLTTSYQWVQRGRVTVVDPYGQGMLQLQPFLGIEIRQPLPMFAFLPARIEALADFRNLLAQGYTPFAASGDQTLLLCPAYRSFRGGFSVMF